MSRGCRPLRGKRRQREPLGWAGARRRVGCAQADGGDRRSHHVEAQARVILAECRKHPALFLRELRDRLARRGVRASMSSLLRFSARHGISRKKGRSTPPSRTART